MPSERLDLPAGHLDREFHSDNLECSYKRLNETLGTFSEKTRCLLDLLLCDQVRLSGSLA
jgi:hypothetical protein